MKIIYKDLKLQFKQVGWLMSNQNTVKTEPIIHFAVSTPIDTTTYPIAFTGATSAANPLLAKVFKT